MLSAPGTAPQRARARAPSPPRREHAPQFALTAAPSSLPPSPTAAHAPVRFLDEFPLDVVLKMLHTVRIDERLGMRAVSTAWRAWFGRTPAVWSEVRAPAACTPGRPRR